MSDLATYLAGLKAGDIVVMQSARDGFSIQEVERVTRTMIVADGVRFWKATGLQTGLGQYGSKIVTPGPVPLKIATMRKCRDTLRQPLTLDTIPAMRAALDRAEAALREGEQ